MRAFEVFLNHEKLCLAGVEGDGVLSADVSSVFKNGEGDLFMNVGGLVTAIGKHVSWVGVKPLKDGDVIQIKVVQSEAVDPPLEYRDAKIRQRSE